MIDLDPLYEVDPLYADAQRKANYTGIEWYIVSKAGRRDLVRCDEFRVFKAHNSKYWQIEFIAFPERAEVE